MSESTQRRTESIDPDEITSWLIEPEVERDDSELEELARSLSEGQEEPITVRENGEGYEGVNGYSRVRAVSQYGEDYGIEALTAEVRDLADFEAARARLVTDVFHEPDTYMDQARLVGMVHENFSSQGDTADFIGKSRTWVSKKLNRLKDPESVQEAGESGAVGEDTAAELSAASEDSPEAVQEAIDFAQQNPEATDADVSEALQEAREADRDTEEVRELVERVEALQSDAQRLESEVNEREQLKAEKQDLVAERSDIRTELPESQAREYESYQEAQESAQALADGVSVIEATVNQLQESADNEALTDSQESKLSDVKRQLNELEGKFGQPTHNAVFGDSNTVTVQETKGYNPEFPSDRTDGMELWTIRVVVDPANVPDYIQNLRDGLESYSEKARTAADYAASIQRSESFKKQAEAVKSQIGEVSEVDTLDTSGLNPRVVEAIENHSGKTLEEFKSELESVREEAENYDTEALQEAYDAYTEDMEKLESLNEEIKEISRDMPAQNVAANLSQKENALEEAQEEAQEAFEALPEETRGGLAETLSEAYDGVEWLTGDGEEPGDGGDICGVETADGTPCQNPAGSCPHHSGDEQEAAA